MRWGGIRVVTLIGTFAVSGCQSGPSAAELLDSGQSQLALRSIQVRAFDTTDVQGTVRSVIATLQDLGFVIDESNSRLGSVSATKLDKYALRITVVVTPRGETQVAVRANAQYEREPVVDPIPYQQFFTALERSLFLSAHAID